MFQPFNCRSNDAFKIVSGGSRHSFVTFAAGKAMSLVPYTSFVGGRGHFLLVGKGRMDDDISLLSLFFFLHILPLCKKHSHTQTTWPEKDLLSHELGRRQAWRLVPTEKSFICG